MKVITLPERAPDFIMKSSGFEWCYWFTEMVMCFMPGHLHEKRFRLTANPAETSGGFGRVLVSSQSNAVKEAYERYVARIILED